MAEQLDSYDFMGSGSGSSYPFDDWLNEKPWKLKRGEDFRCKTISIVTQIRSQAANRGLKVHTANLSDDTLVIQAYRENRDG